MSQSPTAASGVNPSADYFRSWDALGMMLSRGQSFSGQERDCVFLNTGAMRFACVSAATSLDSIGDGRGLAATDWDGDGDLDVWVGERTGPRARLMRNDMPSGNESLELRFEGVTCNRDAIGTRVEVELAANPTRRLIRTLHAGDGFLSQSTKTVHVGLGDAQRAAKLTVRWPGGEAQEFANVAGGRYRLLQGSQLETFGSLPAGPALAAGPSSVPERTVKARVVLTHRLAMPAWEFEDFAGTRHSLSEYQGKRVLINLWASWCPPCIEELTAWTAQAKELESAGWTVIAACSDRVGDAPLEDLAAAKETVAELKLPFIVAEADTQMVRALNILHNQALYKERALPLPTTFVVDTAGRLAAVYRGPATVDQLVADAWIGDGTLTEEALLARAFPFPGKFVYRELNINPVTWAGSYRDSGYPEDALRKLREWLEATPVETRADVADLQPRQVFRAEVYGQIAELEQQLGHSDEALAAGREMVKLAANEPRAHLAMATLLAQAGDVPAAQTSVEQAVQLLPDDASVLHDAARSVMLWGDAAGALTYLRHALELNADNDAARFDLATILQLQGDIPAAVAEYRKLIERNPQGGDAANNLAWLLATDADPSRRDGAEAVRLAELACTGANRQVPAYLGTLAAAYAEAGRFDDAVRTAREALALARGTGQDALAPHLSKRLEQYGRKEAYHEPPRR